MAIADRRQRERAERREQIVAAAERVFFAKGFTATSMDQVAAEAEVSKGTLYLYFKNKDDLFIALSSRFLDHLSSRFERLAKQDGPGLKIVESMMRAYAEVVAERPKHFRILAESLATGYSLDTSVPSMAAHQKMIGRLVALLVSAIDKGKLDQSVREDIDATQVAGQLWGGVFGILLINLNREELQRRTASSLDFSSMVPNYIVLLCDGLAPKRGGQ